MWNMKFFTSHSRLSLLTILVLSLAQPLTAPLWAHSTLLYSFIDTHHSPSSTTLWFPSHHLSLFFPFLLYYLFHLHCSCFFYCCFWDLGFSVSLIFYVYHFFPICLLHVWWNVWVTNCCSWEELWNHFNNSYNCCLFLFLFHQNLWTLCTMFGQMQT